MYVGYASLRFALRFSGIREINVGSAIYFVINFYSFSFLSYYKGEIIIISVSNLFAEFICSYYLYVTLES